MSGDKATPPRLVGFHAAESLRTEKAYRHWGHDIGYTDTPFESGLMFASKLSKACDFIGKQALQQRSREGSDRHLLQCLLQETERFIYHNEPIYMNDQLVGAITTGTYGHTLGAPIGLGWITRSESISPETLEDQRFEVLVDGKKIPASVSLSPMYDPLNARLRS